MTRLLVHVEGETEEKFINEILADHLYSRNFTNVSARMIGNPRLRDRRGGIRSWDSVRKDILNHLREDQECLVTTMVDYYALPEMGGGAWPGRAEAKTLSYSDKPLRVESAIMDDIRREMGNAFDTRRFIPFIVMHEFEGLLFSDCEAFSIGIGRPELSGAFQVIRNQFANPEEINDSPITAPSKRVQGLVNDYEKPLLGTLAILEIGLDAIRSECPHFRDWLTMLEDWPVTQY